MFCASILLALATASPPAAPTALPTVSPAVMKMPMPSFTVAQERFTVKAGHPFQIRLKVTSGTGYSWQPAGPLPPGVTLSGVFQQPRGKMMPGGPGEEVLVFRAANAGTVHLTMEYVRPWERGAKPAKLATFTVSVRG